MAIDPSNVVPGFHGDDLHTVLLAAQQANLGELTDDAVKECRRTACTHNPATGYMTDSALALACGMELKARQQAATTLMTFEVTGLGFDASSCETDDRVFWVRATSAELVKDAIAGTRAGFHRQIDTEDDIDFVLPGQASELRAALMLFKLPAPPSTLSYQGDAT